jgi:hypothetical protein
MALHVTSMLHVMLWWQLDLYQHLWQVWTCQACMIFKFGDVTLHLVVVAAAGPLAVQPSLPRSPQDYSSDEELDNDEDNDGLATSPACFGSSMTPPGTGRSHTYRCD